MIFSSHIFCLILFSFLGKVLNVQPRWIRFVAPFTTQKSYQIPMKEKINPNVCEWSSPDSDKIQNEGESAGEICDEFLRDSGMHGINKLQKSSRSLWRRVIWGLAVLGCSVYLIITVTKEIQKFCTYPTTTSIDVDVSEELPFPAVTVCNLSPLNRSKINPDEMLLNYDLTTSPLGPFAKPINWSDPYYKEHGYFEPISKEFIMNNSSMELSKILYTCLFDNIYTPCEKTFQQIFTSVGPCYTFNIDGSVTTTMKGASYNLNVESFIDQINYYYSFTVGSGVKVVIHDPRDKPDIHNEGLVVGPGSLAYISITKEQYEYLPYPYKAFKDGYCLDLEAKSYKNPLKSSNYSFTACIDECYEELASKTINCTFPHFPGTGRTCSQYEFLKSIGELISLYINKDIGLKCKKQCPLPCKFTKYVTQISYAQYPSDFINGELRRFFGQNLTTEYLRNNYLNVRVFYEHLVTKTVRQVPVYSSWEQILANLGGQMGLFLGASIITLTELLELLIHLVLYCCVKTVRSSGLRTVKNENTKH